MYSSRYSQTHPTQTPLQAARPRPRESSFAAVCQVVHLPSVGFDPGFGSVLSTGGVLSRSARALPSLTRPRGGPWSCLVGSASGCCAEVIVGPPCHNRGGVCRAPSSRTDRLAFGHPCRRGSSRAGRLAVGHLRRGRGRVHPAPLIRTNHFGFPRRKQVLTVCDPAAPRPDQNTT